MSKSARAAIEAEIAGHLDSGDHTAAAAAIIRGYGGEVLSYLAGMSRDPALAEEVYSTVTEDLWRGLPGFRRESSARTWMYRLAYNALQRHRKDPFRRLQKPLSQELEHAAHPVRSRTALFLRTEVKTAVSQLREQLDLDEQTLLILRVDRNLPWREVGEILRQGDHRPSDATLAKRYERVRAKLRRLAEEAGLIPGD